MAERIRTVHIQRIQRGVEAAHDSHKRETERREAIDDAIKAEALRIAEDIGLRDPERGYQFVQSGETPLYEVRLGNGESAERAATLAAFAALQESHGILSAIGDALVHAIAQTSEIRDAAARRVLA